MKLAITFIVFHCGFIMHAVNSCDLVGCIHNLNEILSLQKEPQFECGKSHKMVQCFDDCLQGSSMQKQFQFLMTKVCYNETLLSFAKNGQCMSEHMYELLACFVIASNLKPENDRVDSNLTKCSQLLKVFACPKKVLKSACGQSSADTIGDLLLTLFKDEKGLYCSGWSFIDVDNFKFVFPDDGLEEVSKCFDENSQIVANCSKHTKILDPFHDISGIKCSGNMNFMDCIDSSLGPNCGNEIVSSAADLFNGVASFFHVKSCNTETATSDSVTFHSSSTNHLNSEASLSETTKDLKELISSDQNNGKLTVPGKEITTVFQTVKSTIINGTFTIVTDDLETENIEGANHDVTSNFASTTEKYSLKYNFVIFIISNLI